MGGRKAHYNARIASRICEHIALGLTVKDALAKEPLGPSLQQFWRWQTEYPEFKAKYEMARQMQADLLADDILVMARDVLKQPKFAPAYRVASDILKWQAEIRNPGKYGTKTTIEMKAPPLDPAKIREEIRQLEKSMGIAEVVTPALPAPATDVDEAA